MPHRAFGPALKDRSPVKLSLRDVNAFMPRQGLPKVGRSRRIGYLLPPISPRDITAGNQYRRSKKTDDMTRLINMIGTASFMKARNVIR